MIFAARERLSPLALILIHYVTYIDVQEVVDLFLKRHPPRRLELDKLMKDHDAANLAKNTDVQLTTIFFPFKW